MKGSASSPPSNATTTPSSGSSTPPKRKMISLKSLMASIHCSPIKPITSNDHPVVVSSDSPSNSITENNSIDRNGAGSSNHNRNQAENILLTPPKINNEELDRKLMPSPSKKATLRVKYSPKRMAGSTTSSGITNHRDNLKTPTSHSNTRIAQSCSSSDHCRSSTPVDSPPSEKVETLPMEQVVGFFFLYESHENLKQATYCQVVPLRKGKSLISRKGINDVIKKKKLPLFDHWIQIDRTYISRLHALVEVSNGEFVFIEDLSSSNSTHIVEKTEKRKLNVNIQPEKFYQLRDCNYILFGKLLCQYREKSEMDEQSISEAIQIYYKSCHNVMKTPQKKTPLLVASRDESSHKKQKITIPETPEFNRPSKLPSIREKIIPPTVYADRKLKTPVLAFETPQRIQECLKSQPLENPILSIEQTPPSRTKSSSSTSSAFITPYNTDMMQGDTPNNGSSNDKNSSPKASDQSDHLNLTDVDLSSLSLPDEVYEDIEPEEEEYKQDDMLDDEIVFSDSSFHYDEEENERKRHFDEEDSFIAPKKKLKIKKSDHQSPHILFTGISPTEDNIKAIEKLGGVLVEEPEAELLASRLTHLITDKIRRFVL